MWIFNWVQHQLLNYVHLGYQYMDFRIMPFTHKLLPSDLATSILISLLVLTTSGCTNEASSQAETNPNLSTTNFKSQNDLANASKNNAQQESNQADTQSSSQPSNQFGLQENMLYREARSLLMQKGWQPNVKGDPPNLNDSSVRELIDLGYEEVKDCAGTGLGPCRFEFTNEAGELLVVSAITKGASNRDRVVWRWFLEEKTSADHPITEGLYVLGGTDQGLEVSGEQYRYYDEVGTQEWRPLDQLKYVKEGVIFDGNVYWCIPPQDEPGVCTENGWKSTSDG